MKSPLHSLAAAHRLVCVCFALCAAIAAAQRGHAASGTWNTNSSSNWNSASNWTPTAVPGTAPGDVVGLNNDISLSRTVTINTNVTLGTLNIGDPNSTNPASFTLALTSGTFTLNNSGSGAVINQVATSAGDTITAPFTLADNLTINNNTAINGVATRALTLTGNITQSGGARSLTKTGTGAVILSGSNTYTGGSTISGGALIFRNTASLPSSGTATFGAGTTIGLGVGAAGFFSSANVDSAFGNTLANVSLNASTAIGIDTTAGNFSYTYGGGAGNTRSLVKYGANTLTLSGLSTTAANNYAGATVIDSGTLAIASDAVLTGGLTFGATRMSTQAGSLDLTNASLTTGAIIVQTDGSTVNNTVTLGSGRTLTTNGNVTVGSDLTNITGGNPPSRLIVSGTTAADGTWNVNSSNGTFRVGVPNGTRGGSGTLDMSGLAAFSADLRTGATGSSGGTFAVGGLSGNANGGTNTLTLAANSTIRAAALDITSPNGEPGTQSLKLGSGTQILNANTIRMSAGSRDSALVNFNTAAGTIQLRGAAGGSSSANLTMLAATTTSGGATATFDVSGHSADMIFNNLKVLEHNAGFSNTAHTAIFSFDTGTMSATLTQIGSKYGGNMGTATATATVNIGSAGNFTNTAALGTLKMGLFTTAGTTGTGSLNATLNVTGSNTAATFGDATMANYTGTLGATVNSAINLSGGSLAGTGGINMAAGTTGTVNSTITLTGGSLSVGSSGVSGTNGIYRTITGATVAPTLIVNGGVLNMNGNAIGNASNLITTDFRSGTLSNVGEINGGAGLVKTTSGTLALSGTNAYTGATTISAGILSFGGTSALAGTSGLTIAGGAGLIYTGGAATFTKPVTITAGSGTGTITNAGGGLLTLSGNLSKDNSVLRLTGGSFDVTGTISGATPGASDLLVDGTSTVTLSSANTYDGPTFVNQSSNLIVGIANAIPGNSVVTLGNATTTGTLSLGSNSNAIGGLRFDLGGGTLRMTASATGATAQLTAASGTMTLTGGTLDLGGSGTSAGYYRLLAAQSIAGSFTSITGTSAAYQVLTTATSIDYQQRAVLGALTVTNPAVSIITGGSAAFTYTVANSAFSGGASLGFSSGSLSANLAGVSSGTASAGGPSTSISGLVFTGTAVGSNQQGTFTVSAPTAYGATSTTGTVSVTVLEHATSSLAGSLLTSTTISLGTWNYATSSWESGGDTGLFSIYNLAGGSGPGLTADLSLLSVTGTAEGFTTNLASYADIAGGTSSQFSVFFNPAGLSTSTTKSTTFQIAMSDKTGMSGATNTNTLFVTANVVVVPEPGALALAGAGVGIAAWAIRMRRPGRARPARAGCGAA